MSEPLPTNAEMKKSLEAKLTNGSIANSDRIWDRDEVHEIYKTWREVFNQYDPPLTYVSILSIYRLRVKLMSRAVAEAWVASDRKHLYASSSGLGQSFSFDMLMCNYDCKEFKDTIAQSLKDAQSADGSTTWVFSSTSPPSHLNVQNTDCRPRRRSTCYSIWYPRCCRKGRSIIRFILPRIPQVGRYQA
jgi:alpha-glucosidase